MTEFNLDLEALLDDVMKGNDPVLDALDTPEPLEPDKPEVILSPESDEAIPTLADILASPEEESCQGPIEAAKEAVPTVEQALSEVQELASPHGTEPEDSATIDAGDDNDQVEAGSTTSESTEDLHACKIDPVDESQWSVEVEVAPVPLPEFTSDDLMEDLDIRNYGTLVSLNTLRWHAKVRDHSAAINAAAATGADEGAYEARKRLLVGADQKLKRVHTAIDAARTEHYRMTLPWSTVGVNDHGKRAGPRLLPNTLFFDYTQKMGKFKQEMLTALDEFVVAYPTLIALAQKKLGSAFDFSEYPQPSAIRNYFGLTFDFLPIPIGEDFGNVTLHQAEKLAMNVNKKTRQMLENAMQDAWKRLQDDMEHAYSTLRNPNAKFHYTLIAKMKENASMLSHLNVTKDPRIEAIRARIDKDLAKRDVKEIRKDDALRKHMSEEARDVLKLMKEYTDDCQSQTD